MAGVFAGAPDNREALDAPDLKAGWGASMPCRRSSCWHPRPTAAPSTPPFRTSSTSASRGFFWAALRENAKALRFFSLNRKEFTGHRRMQARSPSCRRSATLERIAQGHG